MLLRTIHRTEKDRSVVINVDGQDWGALPVRALPPFCVINLSVEIQASEAEELLNILRQLALRESLDYLAKAERSSAQCKALLQRRRLRPDIIDGILAYCTEKRYLDDARFAEIFIRSWLNRGAGINLIRSKLFPHRIAAGIWEPIYNALMETGEHDDKLTEMLQKYLSRQPDMPLGKLKDKVFNYFIRKGFDLDTIASAWAKRNEKEA